MPVIFWMLLLIPGILHCYAQDERKLKLYSASDGLSDNNISALEQDDDGYLWVGTARGLNRYDGKKFIQIHSGTTSFSLPDESITCLSWLDKRRLGVSTAMGMHIIDVCSGKARDLIVPVADKKYLAKFNQVMSALSDKKGNIYLLTRSGLYHFDSAYNLVFRYDYYTRKEIETEYFTYGNNLFWLSAFEILVTTIDGGYIYDTRNKKLSKIRNGNDYLGEIALMDHDEYLIRQTNPYQFLVLKAGVDSLICIDAAKHIRTASPSPLKNLQAEFGWRSVCFHVNDSLFYITSRGRGYYKIKLDKQTMKLSIDTTRHLSGYYCKDFILDKEKRWWVATNAGLLKEANADNSVTQVPLPHEVLKLSPDTRIKSICSVGDKLFVGCIRDGGLQIYDKASLSFLKHISFRKYGIEADNVYALLPAGKDSLLIAANSFLFLMNTKTGGLSEIELKDYDRKLNWVSSLFKDSKGNIWVLTNEIKKVYLRLAGQKDFVRHTFNDEDFKKIMVVGSVAEDKQGNVWMGGQGICRFGSETFFPDYYLDTFPFIQFPRRDISAMAFDKNQVLWFGVVNNGLVGFNPATGVSTLITSQEGLPDNYIQSIYPIDNKLWVGTATGIASIDPVTHKISRFGNDDGFALLPLTSTNFYFDSASRYFYCGFTDHITRFSPDSLLYGQQPPNFFVESIRFLNDSMVYHPKDELSIPYNNNDLAVTMGTINYNDVSNQRMDYRISNTADTTWKTLSGDQINFNNLSPGDYKLQMRLYAANNRWPTQSKELRIVIRPPFWKSAWFVALMWVVLFSLLYLIYRINVNGVKRRERAKVQLQELKAEEYRNRLELEKISSYFSSSMSDKCSVDEVLWDVARNLIGRIGYTDCMIYLWNADKTKMVQKAGFGPKGTPEDLADRLFDVEPGQGVVGYVMQTKKPVLISDTTKDGRYRKDDIFRLSEIAVPIIHNDELMGVLDSEHEQLNYFRERDLKILTTIATLVGNKIVQVESENILADKIEDLATINEQLAEAQLKALQTQMNPHFIFNALNSIKRLILDNENRNASRYLSKFAQMIRLTLNHSKETFVTLQETIEYLNAYLEMEQLRFGSSFTYQIEVLGKPDEEDIDIPTLMIQPLVENAIWHGLMHREGEKRIMIRFLITDDWVTCTIEDNGIGIRKSEKMNRGNRPPSVGLDNLRNRIKIMNEKYRTSCLLVLEDLAEMGEDECGTRVTLRFRFIHDKTIMT